MTYTTQIPHLEILGLQIKIKVFVGKPRFISRPCLDSLIDDEGVDVIHVTNGTWIKDIS